ncbi:type IV secretion system protein [Phaeobacter piscinae]|uniref:type IV secretion system protein n=1 Tax=Phaeobacter piscinae TaxID=1580596 RepID=UPI00058D4BD3|nr:type IV secretion system protein [Phaeobacter piscinae]UTS79110.1 Type IV secretion system protein VirB6 [Phaeobacter piscinae]
MWENLYSDFIDAVSNTANTIAGTMSAELTAPLTAAMTLYIILYGIAIMKGAIQEPVLDFAIRGIKLAIIWSLVSSAGDYTAWVGNVINKDMPNFVDALAGGSGTGKLPSDPVFSKSVSVAERVYQHHVSQGLAGKIVGPIYYAIVMLLGGVVLSGVALVFSLWATLGLTIMAAIGPLFICFALFETTRGWFMSWLGQILNFATFKLLIYVLSLTIILMLERALVQTDLLPATMGMFYFAGVTVTGIIFFFLLPSIAASLSSGAQASTGMLQRAAERYLGRHLGGGGGGNNHTGSASKR